MLKFRKENKVTAEEEKENSMMKNIIKISVAVGGVAITGLAVKQFLFGEEKEYAEQEITQVEKSEKPEEESENTPETQDMGGVQMPAKPEPETDIVKIDAEDTENIVETIQSFDEVAEEIYQSHPEMLEDSDLTNSSEKLQETEDGSVKLDPVTTALEVYQHLWDDDNPRAGLLAALTTVLDESLSSINIEDLKSSDRFIVNRAIKIINAKLVIYWISALNMLNNDPSLKNRCTVYAEGGLVKESYDATNVLEKNADVLKYQEEVMKKLRELEKSEFIGIMEDKDKMEGETQTSESEQVSDENQTAVNNVESVDEIQATDEAKEGETQTSESNNISNDSLSVPIMEMVKVPEIKTREEELFEQADKLIQELSELVPDEVPPVTSVQISAVQSIVLQVARLYSELVSEVGSTVQTRKIRRYVNNTITDLLSCCRTALTHPDLCKVEDAVYIEAIEDVVLMVKTVGGEVSGFWRERTMDICDEITNIITESQTATATESDGVPELPVSNIPEIKEFGARIEAVRDLLGSEKASDAKDYYRSNLASYVEDPNLPEDIKERIKRVGDKITDTMIAQKQVAATTETPSKNRHSHKNGKKKGGNKNK